MRKDRQATMDKQFLDPDSYVTPDGREVLHGEDWKARVEDLRLRSAGRCEHVGSYFDIWTEKSKTIRCPVEAADAHHVIRRSVKRDDRLSNLQALCRFHHDLLDNRHIKSDRAGKKKQPQFGASNRVEA